MDPGIDRRKLGWPDDRPFSGAGFTRVDTEISCVITRFNLRSSWALLPFYLAFRRIRREAKQVAGLLYSGFFLENRRTCYTFSLWKNDSSIVNFGTVRSHINAANSVFAGRYGPQPEIWSAQFRLWAVSSHNQVWKGLDWKTLLTDESTRIEKVFRSDIAVGEAQ